MYNYGNFIECLIGLSTGTGQQLRWFWDISPGFTLTFILFDHVFHFPYVFRTSLHISQRSTSFLTYSFQFAGLQLSPSAPYQNNVLWTLDMPGTSVDYSPHLPPLQSVSRGLMFNCPLSIPHHGCRPHIRVRPRLTRSSLDGVAPFKLSEESPLSPS